MRAESSAVRRFWRSIARCSTRWRRPTGSIATSSRRSGASSQILALREATVRSCDRPPHWHVSAGAKTISVTSSSPRWKSLSVATSVRSVSRVPGLAHSARLSSCPHRSNATRSISTVTVAATWSIRRPILSGQRPTTLRPMDGWRARPGGTRWSCPPALTFSWPTAPKR